MIYFPIFCAKSCQKMVLMHHQTDMVSVNIPNNVENTFDTGDQKNLPRKMAASCLSCLICSKHGKFATLWVKDILINKYVQ